MGLTLATTRKMKHLVCEACWNEIFNTEAIQKFWVQEDYTVCYTTTWARTIQSAGRGCNWCTFLKSVLPSPDSSQWPSNWIPTTKLSVILEEADLMDNTVPRGLNQCQIDLGTAGSPRDWHVEFDLFFDDIRKSDGIVTARPLQTSVNSAGAYLQIEEWLDQCNRHPDCIEACMDMSLPSRVIEVASADSSGIPRLRSTRGLEGSYVALSYCWGSNQTYVLTSKNVEVLMEGLDVSFLSQSVKDAIEVTGNLGFKYLWVDALCIMQDTTEKAAQVDMENELAMMNRVYKNAAMTIVAACVPSATDGFLKDRPEPGQHHFDIPCRLTLEYLFVAHIREHVMYDDKHEPINDRAWTFQEQLLSPRLLIYASHTLQWQCRTLTCNMGGSYHSPNPSAAPRLPPKEMLLPQYIGNLPEREHPSLEYGAEIPHLTLQHWLRIVTSYSTRKSSLSRDKLVAISALAVSYADVFGPKYLAGIWARSAVQQLCWRSPDRRRFFTRPLQYGAPSWSWAALDGQVYFPSFLQRDNTSVCVPYRSFKSFSWYTDLKTAGLDYGEVTGGQLIVSAILRAGIFDPSRSPAIHFKDAYPSQDLHYNEANLSPADQDPTQTAQGGSDTAEDSFTRPVRCLGMYHSGGTGSSLIGGLMLVESSEADGLFRRIGWCSADLSAFEGHLVETIGVL